jgi:hypothetical protein
MQGEHVLKHKLRWVLIPSCLKRTWGRGNQVSVPLNVKADAVVSLSEKAFSPSAEAAKQVNAKRFQSDAL